MASKDSLARMQAGQIYDPNHVDLLAQQTVALDLMYDYNATRPSQGERRTELIQQMFAEAGVSCYVEPPSTPIGAAAMCTSVRGCTPTSDSRWSTGPTPGCWTRGVITRRSAA
ncbi:hypothetical protein FH969_14290 [Miniimonas arenae]|uniref:Maltose/galactoside acetyltransferase domain-containing protein n=1 Tax=Miniimonas arenae TaxID=676201 RepID=A0A5C5B7L7_9MICO|nr:hypothetical protein FH969_14290 [Miniimonas arenae]